MLKKIMQKAFNTGSSEKFGDLFAISANKQYYYLCWAPLNDYWAILRKLNKNPKNLLEHYYSEDEAEIEMASTIVGLVATEKLFSFLKEAINV